jgi:hypothetical protein
MVCIVKKDKAKRPFSREWPLFFVNSYEYKNLHSNDYIRSIAPLRGIERILPKII